MRLVGRIAAIFFILAPLGLAHAAGPSNAAPAQDEAPPAREFWIFFDSGQFKIHPADADILDQAAAAIKKLGRPKVVLTGHTDMTGLHTSDVRLSQWRADEVKKYLVKHGVPADDITTVAKGESDPRVPTPRGVASEDNRNVHIELK
ncbi:MAG TPA: OmpA family protein [Alphaproteobacteria bacterium]|nr:OmpA family protein [Alphaproteobacteria bacterium]